MKTKNQKERGGGEADLSTVEGAVKYLESMICQLEVGL